MGVSKYTFKSNGKVIVDTVGFASELSYEVDDKNVKISGPQGNLIMTIKDDKSIEGPLGLLLTKKPK